MMTVARRQADVAAATGLEGVLGAALAGAVPVPRPDQCQHSDPRAEPQPGRDDDGRPGTTVAASVGGRSSAAP
jgi:hypothetical protein